MRAAGAWVRRVWFKALEAFGIIAVLITFGTWLSECEDRTIERRYRAWELINAAAYLPGDGGRSDALENLVKDGRSLTGAVLDFAHLPGINLSPAEPAGQGVDLSRASMKDAQLYGADLEGAVLHDADLRGADLSSSLRCPGTHYYSSSKDNWRVRCEEPLAETRTNLKRASLLLADLQGAHLINADLTGASLTYAMLDDADLQGADLTCAYLDWVDLGRTRNLVQSQLENALGGRKTGLPEGLEPPCHWGYPKEGCVAPHCPRP